MLSYKILFLLVTLKHSETKFNDCLYINIFDKDNILFQLVYSYILLMSI